MKAGKGCLRLFRRVATENGKKAIESIGFGNWLGRTKSYFRLIYFLILFYKSHFGIKFRFFIYININFIYKCYFNIFLLSSNYNRLTFGQGHGQVKAAKMIVGWGTAKQLV